MKIYLNCIYYQYLVSRSGNIIMNYLYCKVSSNPKNERSVTLTGNTIGLQEPCLYSNSKLQLEVQRVPLNEKQNKSIKIYKHVVISLIGEIHNLDEFMSNESYDDDLDGIFQLYTNSGIRDLNRLDGFFTISIVDNMLSKLFIVQDRHTSLHHLYYYNNSEGIHISSDVKLLLKNANIAPKVNKNALPTYLHYAFVPGNETLFQDIYKLPAELVFEYDLLSNQFSLNPFPLVEEFSLTEDKEKELIQAFDEALLSRMKEMDTKQIAVMYSGGYDSNFLLSRILHYKPDIEIKLFSYGSSSPKSEIHNIRRIVNIYKQKGYKLELIDYTINASDLQRLPNMMFALGEPISEPGLIFQSCLADLFHKNNIDIVIGGDANDQVYDKQLYYKMVEKLVEPKAIYDYPRYGRLRLGEVDRIFTYKFFTDIEIAWLLNDNDYYPSLKLSLENYSTVFTNYFLTKRLVFKQHGITSRLPFLSSKYINFIEKHLEEEDLIFKELHVQMSKENLPDEVYQELIKATESTSPYSYVFLEDKAVRQKIFQLILNSETTKEFFNLSAVQRILEGFDFAIEYGKHTEDYYKASVLSCRIFTILGFLVWHNIFISQDKYIQDMQCNADLYEILGVSEVTVY